MEYVRKSSHIYFFCASLTNFILGNGLDKKKEQKDDVHPHISVLNASVVLSGSVWNLTMALNRGGKDWKIFACK